MNEKKKKKIKDKKFTKAFIENNGNATQAYLAVNPEYKGNSAGELGSRMLKKVELSDNEIMQELGITDNYLYEKLKEGTLATKHTRQGKKVEDYGIRHQYIDTILKLKSKYPKAEMAIELEEKNAEQEFYKRLDSILNQLTTEELREIVYSDPKKEKENKANNRKEGRKINGKDKQTDNR